MPSRKGAKNIIVDEQLMDIVEAHAAQGMNFSDTALVLGFSDIALRNQRRKHALLELAWQRGKAKGKLLSHKRITELMAQKHFNAIKWYQQSVHKMNDRPDIPIDEKGPNSLSDLMKDIEKGNK